MKQGKLLTISVIFLAATFVLSTPGLTIAKERKWNAGGAAAPNTLDDDTLVKCCSLVKEKTNGKLIIDEFPVEQLGPYRDMYENVVRGTQESGLLPLSPEFDKRLQAGYTIYLAETWEEGRKVYGPGGRSTGSKAGKISKRSSARRPWIQFARTFSSNNVKSNGAARLVSRPVLQRVIEGHGIKEADGLDRQDRGPWQDRHHSCHDDDRLLPGRGPHRLQMVFAGP